MKTLKLMIVAILVVAPLCLANAAPLVDAGPAGLHPAELSLPGLTADVTVAMGPPATANRAKADEVKTKRLHPSQLSLEGELVEDVLAPPARKTIAADVLACGR